MAQKLSIAKTVPSVSRLVQEMRQYTLQDKIFFYVFAAKVGKTSLIMSLVSEEFPDEVRMSGQSDEVV